VIAQPNEILIVDDEVGIRDLLSEILQDEGYQVSVAENAGQARSYRARAQPSLVLLDIWMPDTDGVTLLREWAAAAARADVVVIGGFCERGEDGRVYNSAAVVDGAGVRAVYRKLHLWDNEHAIFTPGSQAPPVIETRVGRIGVVICYDLEFPELTRSVALAGAQLLAVPANWPLFPRPDGERPSEVTIAMATGRINKMAVACSDRVGLERGQDWTGGATIVDPDGWVAAESRAPGLVTAEVDLQLALDKRLTDRADVFGDRRPELYDAVTR